jgi:hypothetical protein
MPTDRAHVSFRVKEPGAEPVISVEQSSSGAEILPANIYFELAAGTSLKDAEKIAAYLNETIEGIVRIS